MKKQLLISVLIAFVVVLLMCTTIKAAKPIENADGTITIVPYTKTGNDITDDEYNLLCRVLCLEDGGECEYSQRCVASAIYNRWKSGRWGTAITDVIYAEGQFEVVPHIWDYGVCPSETTKAVITDVFINGNSCLEPRVMYFRTGYFFSWARAEFNVGNVYFSSSWWDI